jgi:membrane-associated protease RseP (regulator of RpoE activity)
MSVLWTTLLVIFFLAAICAHEAAHALALRKLGYQIVEAGLGLPFPPQLTLQPSKRVPFKLTLSPWLLGAYVSPDQKQQKEIEALPYQDIAWYSGAGVVANFLIGGVMWGFIDIYESHWLKAAIVILSTIGLWFGRRQFTAYILPVLAIPLLFLFGHALATTVGQPQGIIGLGAEMVMPSWYAAFTFAFSLTMALGILNLLPIFPFDGGRITNAAIIRLFGEKSASWFRNSTAVLAMCLLVYSVVADFVWLAH